MYNHTVKLHTYSAFKSPFPLLTSVLLGRKLYSRSTAALHSTGSVDSTGSDFGITQVIFPFLHIKLILGVMIPCHHKRVSLPTRSALKSESREKI